MRVFVGFAIFSLLLWSCEKGKAPEYQISGQSPLKFYSQYISPEEKCNSIYLSKQDPLIKVTLKRDQTYTAITEGIETQGPWEVRDDYVVLFDDARKTIGIISNPAIYTQTDKDGKVVTKDGKPVKTETFQISWKSQEIVDAVVADIQRVGVIHDKCDRTNPYITPRQFPSKGAATGRVEIESNSLSRTILVKTAPEKIKGIIQFEPTSSAFEEFVGELEDSIKACSAAKATLSQGGELAAQKIEELRKIAGIVRLDLPEQGYAKEFYAEVKAEVEKEDPENKYNFIPEKIVYLEKAKQVTPLSLNYSITQINPSLAKQEFNTYKPILGASDRIFQVNIGQYCDLIVPKASVHIALWVSGEKSDQKPIQWLGQ